MGSVWEERRGGEGWLVGSCGGGLRVVLKAHGSDHALCPETELNRDHWQDKTSSSFAKISTMSMYMQE